MNAPDKPQRRRVLRWTLDLLLIVLVIGSVRLWMQRGMADGEAPPLSAVTLDGAPFSLADRKGPPLLLHFWATWCGVCSLSQSGVDALARDRPVITVAMNSGDAAAVRRHLRQHGLSHPVIVDPENTIAARFGVSAVPASFIIDREQRIRYRSTGYAPAWELRLRLWWYSLRG